MSAHFSSILPIDRTLSGSTTPGQSGPRSDSNNEVLRIPKISSISGTSPSDCFMSYQDNGGVLSLCRDAVGVFYSPQPTGWLVIWYQSFLFSWMILNISYSYTKSRIFIWLYDIKYSFQRQTPSGLGLELLNMPTASLQRINTPPQRHNYLMVTPVLKI